MTSAHDSRDTGFGSPAADSAKCLLVVCGYRDNAAVLRYVGTAVTQRILMSPSLSDFFGLRLVDLGPRPAPSADRSAAVARIVLELTSRPEAARNFSALMIIDESAAVVDQLLHDCEADRVLAALKVRLRGTAATDHRVQGPDPGGTPEIVITGRDRWPDVLVHELLVYAERLLSDFGSGWEPGLPVERVDELEAVAQSEHRGVIQAAARAEAEASREASRIERRRAEERSREAERQRESERRGEAERRREVERQHEAERQQEVERRRELERKQEAEVAARAANGERNAGELRPDAEVEKEVERWAKESERRIAELEAELKAERERAVAGSGREAEVKQPESKPEPPPGEGSREQAQQMGQSGGLLKKIRGRSAQQEGRARPGEGAALLLDALARLTGGDLKQFEACLRRLVAYTSTGVSAGDRQQCRVIAIEGNLLRPGVVPAAFGRQFYDVLLRLVYGLPLSYWAYCEIEDLLRQADGTGLQPQRALVEAIDGGGQTDIRVMAITRYFLGHERLSEWFRTKQPNVEHLISALAGEWERPHHAHLLCAVTLQYLNEYQGPYQQHVTRSALRSYGYLAAALSKLYAEKIQDQVAVLAGFLYAAYPAGLDRPTVKDIFALSEPSSALARAVLQLLADPDDRILAVRVFADRIRPRLGTGEIDAEQEAKLVQLLTSDRDR